MLDKATILLCLAVAVVAATLVLLFMYFDRPRKRKVTPARRKEIERLRRESIPGLVELYVADADAADNQDEEDGEEPANAPRDDDLTGVFHANFGTVSQPHRAVGALDRAGIFHVTFTSLLLQGESRRMGVRTFVTEGKNNGGAITLRLTPENTTAIYDAGRCIIALHDSANPRRWVLVQPRAAGPHQTREAAFTALIAALVAVLGARIEPATLRGFSIMGLAKAALGILLALIGLAALLLAHGLLRPH